MSVKTYVRDNLAVIIMCDNVNWVQFNRGTEICSVRLRHDKAGAILVMSLSFSVSSQSGPPICTSFRAFLGPFRP